MKKIISVLLVFLLTFLLCTNLYAQENTEAADNSGIEFIKQTNDVLGIFDGVDMTEGRVVSRGEFADLLIRALGIDGIYEPTFADVKEDTPYAASISAAAKLGIISGSGNGLFDSTSPITYPAAVRMAVGALGYDKIAQYTGGFPLGYYRIASNIELTKGMVKDSGNLTFSDVSILLANALQCDMCTVTAVVGDDISQMRAEGKSILSEYYHLTKIEGIIQQAGYVSMKYGAYIENPAIIIDGFTFKTGRDDISNYLGYKATGWYDEMENMNIIVPDKNIKTISVDAKVIDSFSDNIIKTFDENGNISKKYTLSDDFTFVRNGRVIAHESKDFIFEAGSLFLIDNNNDGRYDVVNAKVSEYVSVSYKNTATNTVFDKNIEGGVILDTMHGYMCKIYLANKDGNFEEIEFDDLPKDAIMQVYRSDDGRYAEVYATTATLKGVVQEVSEETVLLSGTEYKLNSYFRENYSLDAGKEYILCLASDNTIAAISQGSRKALKYGFVYKYARDTKSIEKTIELVMFTEDGTHQHGVFADVFTLNGELLKAGDAGEKLDTILTNGNSKVIPQLVRYKLSDDGKIISFDTRDTVSSGTSNEERYKVSPESEDDLTLTIENLRSAWYVNSFLSHLYAGGNTVIFRVPADILTIDTASVDEELFKICGGADFINYQRYNLDAYDVNTSLSPGAIVVYHTANSASIDKTSTQMIVEDIKTAVDDEGERGYNLYLWAGGVYYTYFITNDRYLKLTAEGNKPQSGDIVRVAYDHRGYISGLLVDARYNPSSGQVEITANAPRGGQVDESCYWGYVYDKGDQNFSIDITKGGKSGYNGTYGDEILNNLTPFSVNPSIKVAIYDSEKKVVLQGTYTDLQDEVTVGKEEASYVFVACRSHIVSGIFLFK